MQITHQEARHLIQSELDGGISIRQRQLLDSHLASCSDCQRYAESIQNVETILRPLLQRQWNRQPVPLSMSVLTSRAYPKTSSGMILATRIAAIGVVFAVCLFGAWQFNLSKPISFSSLAASAPPIPVPSTSTKLVITTQTQPCEETQYVVREDDTIDSVADKFQVSKEQLLSANNLKPDVMRVGTQLLIPTCNTTPTAYGSTTTFTPTLLQITSTPGG